MLQAFIDLNKDELLRLFQHHSKRHPTLALFANYVYNSNQFKFPTMVWPCK